MKPLDPKAHGPAPAGLPSTDAAQPAPLERAGVEHADDDLPAPPSDDEVAALVERAQDGDVDSLNDLFRRYHEHIIQLARRNLGARLRAKEEPDDLAQTTFREATRDFRKFGYRGEGSLLRWLQRILHNKIRDKAEYYAAGKRDISRETPADAEGPTDQPLGARNVLSGKGPPVSAQAHEEHSILRAALTQLSADHRKAITLVFFQGRTLREAGQELDGRSEDAVRMLLKRAKDRLAELTRSQLGQ
ncbi:MAG: sigma-70 family RNA polymerase sigma factor [Planctomycetota bacterium]